MAANELRVLTLAEIRKQCNIDFEDDDAQLKLIGIASEDAVIEETRRSLDELIVREYNSKNATPVETVTEIGTGAAAWFPQRLKQAMLLLAADLYKNREISTDKAQNRVKTYDILTKPYRRLVNG